jgi:hypothetical protein
MPSQKAEEAMPHRARTWTKAGALLWVILSCLAYSSCGGGGAAPAPPPPVTISISPTTASLTVSSTEQFEATVGNTANTSVTWAVNGKTGGSSTMGTISASGLYTAPDLVPSPASVTVTATSQADSTKSASATVSLTYPTPKLTSVSPSYVLVDSPDTTLTLVGSALTRASTVNLNGTALKTTFVSTTKLTAVLAAGNEKAEGKFSLTVVNPAPGGGTSSGQEFDVAGVALTVNIIDLPAGSPANVTVSGPNGLKLTLTSTQTFAGSEGAYTVSAAGVAVGASTYYATVPTLSVSLAAGGSGAVTVDYYTIIPNTTKVLDQSGMQSLAVSSDGTTLTISNSSEVAKTLEVGDVLIVSPVPASPRGLLVKILTVSESGSNIVATVGAATLEDAIERIDLTFSKVLDPTNVISQPASASIKKSSKSLKGGLPPKAATDTVPDSCSGNPSTFTKPFDFPVTGPSDSLHTSKVEGSIEFCPAFNISLKMSAFKVQSFSISVSLGEHTHVSGQLGLLGDLDFDSTKEGLFPSYQFEPILIWDFPPIWVTPTITPFVDAQGSVQAALEVGVTQDATAEAGASYSNGKWTPIHTLKNTFGEDPLSIDGGMSAKASAGIRVNFLIYSSIGPFISADGYLSFNADITQNPWWKLSAGIEGPVGIQVEFLGHSLGDFNLPDVFDFSIVLLKASGGFSLTDVTPTLAAVTPTMAPMGSPDLGLSLTGTNFVPDSIASFNGNALTTSFTDTGHLTATLPAAYMIMSGVYPVNVSNPDTNGAASSAINFDVTGAQVTISPGSAAVRLGQTQQFTATVAGVSNGSMTWSVNGTPGGSSSAGTVSASGLYTAPSALPSPNTVSVTATSVADPTQSGSATVTIENPVPVLNSVSPTSIPVGNFTLQVTGSSFVTGAQVIIGTTALSTTFVSSSQLTATGVATTAQVGTEAVKVTNPNPGSASSSAINVSVVNVSAASSGSTAIIVGQVNGQFVDKAYIPLPNSGVVSVINADASAGAKAQVTSIALPAGYSPNASGADQSLLQVVVISYSSPDVQVIDASTDTLAKSVTSPVTQSFSFSGGGCMICGITVDPTTNKAILDTAQGYLLLDLSTFTFSPFIATHPAENFGYNPNSASVVSPFYDEFGLTTAPGVQAINLAGNAIFDFNFTGGSWSRPDSAAVDVATNVAVVADEDNGTQVLINMNGAAFDATSSPPSFSAPNTVFSTASPSCGLNNEWTMMSIESSSHLLFLGTEYYDDCAGVETLPTSPVSGAPPAPAIFNWGHMPSAPDLFAWQNGTDPHGIGVFTSVVDGKAYGFLIRADQAWVARIDLLGVANAPPKAGGLQGEVDLTSYVTFYATQ